MAGTAYLYLYMTTNTGVLIATNTQMFSGGTNQWTAVGTNVIVDPSSGNSSYFDPVASTTIATPGTVYIGSPLSSSVANVPQANPVYEANSVGVYQFLGFVTPVYITPNSSIE
jgi:hypothetical protein